MLREAARLLSLIFNHRNMKKSIAICLVMGSVTLACKKNQDAPVTQAETVSHAYSALDKTRAKATFTSSPKVNTVTIEANNMKYVLDKKGENLYERNGVSARIEGDSLFIEQGGQVIPLKKLD